MFWEVLGVNWFDLLRMPLHEFEEWATPMEKELKRREQEAREADRG